MPERFGSLEGAVGSSDCVDSDEERKFHVTEVSPMGWATEQMPGDLEMKERKMGKVQIK